MLNVTFYTKNTETDKVSVTKNEKCYLNTLVTGKYFFGDSTDVYTISYKLPSLINGEKMYVNCTNLEEITSDFPSLSSANQMFQGCTSLYEFKSKLPSLENGTSMFENCSSLITFKSDLSNLVNGDLMFSSSALETFKSDLSSLESATNMFANTKLTEWDTDMYSLKTATGMFNGCVSLSSFIGDLSDVTDATNMFSGCSSLTSFSGDLHSLETADGMFSGCLLDAASVMNVVESINDGVYEAPITIGVGCSNEGKDSFAQNATYENWNDLCRTISDKGWVVQWSLNGATPINFMKYNNCIDYNDCRTVDANVHEDVDENGAWNYYLDNLEVGGVYNANP